MMQDDDCVHVHPKNIELCSGYLKSKPAVPYLVIRYGSGCIKYPECLRLKFVIARKEFLSRVTFWADSVVCAARQLEMQARSKGLVPRYYQAPYKMIEEVGSSK